MDDVRSHGRAIASALGNPTWLLTRRIEEPVRPMLETRAPATTGLSAHGVGCWGGLGATLRDKELIAEQRRPPVIPRSGRTQRLE